MTDIDKLIERLDDLKRAMVHADVVSWKVDESDLSTVMESAAALREQQKEIEQLQADNERLRGALKELARCPRCDSPDPRKHPALQFEGEVQVCSHPWHLEASNESG